MGKNKYIIFKKRNRFIECIFIKQDETIGRIEKYPNDNTYGFIFESGIEDIFHIDALEEIIKYCKDLEYSEKLKHFRKGN